MVRKISLTLAAALLATTLAAASAQTMQDHAGCAGGDGAPMAGMGAMMGGGTGQMMPGGMAMMAPLSHIEGRIAFLKADLAITDAQASQWAALADAMREHATFMRNSMGAMMGSMMKTGQPANVPERNDAMVATMSAGLESMKAVAAAEKSLYAVLTDPQEKTADELLGGPMMGMVGRSM